jgi:hypothetical protein
MRRYSDLKVKKEKVGITAYFISVLLVENSL